MSDSKMKYMLTTVDNPWNPWTNFDDWLLFDKTNHYYTCEMLAKYCTANDDALGSDFVEEEWEICLDELIQADHLGLYMKIAKDDDPKIWVPFVQEEIDKL